MAEVVSTASGGQVPKTVRNIKLLPNERGVAAKPASVTVYGVNKRERKPSTDCIYGIKTYMK